MLCDECSGSGGLMCLVIICDRFDDTGLGAYGAALSNMTREYSEAGIRTHTMRIFHMF